MSTAPHTPKGLPLPEHHRAVLRAVVEAEGERGACARTGLSRNAIVRALAGLGLYRGTHELLCRRLGLQDDGSGWDLDLTADPISSPSGSTEGGTR